jgi:tetratricopeptide (TPR) repeat protein
LANLATGTGWQSVLALAGWAAGIQIIFLAETSHSLLFRFPLIDAASYHRQALDILAGIGQPGAFWQPPGYPCFLAGLARLFGSDPACLQTAQALLLAPAVSLLTWRIGLRLLPPAWAFLAGLSVAATGPLLFYHSQLLAAAPAAVLVSSAILLALRATEKPSVARWAATGAALGLAALCVAPAVALAPALAAFAWSSAAPRRIRALRAASLLAGLLLITTPVTLRNHAACGRWVWISANSGANFYIGNNHNWETTLTAMPELDWNKLLRIPYLQDPTIRNPVDADRYFQRLTLQEALREPGAFCSRLARKALAFWHGRELPRNIDFTGWRDPSRLLQLSVWHAGVYFPTGVLVPLALVGTLALRRKRTAVLLAVSAVSFGLLVALFFPCSRYRLPVLPLIVVLACAGAHALACAVRARNLRASGTWVALLLLAGLAANRPLRWPTDAIRYDAHLWYAVGAGAQVRNDLPTARRCYEQALRFDPSLADARFNLGRLYADQQDPARAEACYESATALRPDHDRAHVNLAILLAARNQTDAALRHLALAETVNPRNAEAWYNHAALLIRAGRKADALAPLEQASQLNPQYIPQCRALQAALQTSSR